MQRSQDCSVLPTNVLHGCTVYKIKSLASISNIEHFQIKTRITLKNLKIQQKHAVYVTAVVSLIGTVVLLTHLPQLLRSALALILSLLYLLLLTIFSLSGIWVCELLFLGILGHFWLFFLGVTISDCIKISKSIAISVLADHVDVLFFHGFLLLLFLNMAPLENHYLLETSWWKSSMWLCCFSPNSQE